MTNNAVANRNALDPGSDRLDPARILMAHDVGKLDVNLAAPNAFDDMQVGATDARAANAHDDVHRA
jgi:hypothetical protein